MSHFPVTVILPAGATPARAERLVEKALAPFDENISVEEYPVPLTEDPAMLVMLLDEKGNAWTGESLDALRQNATELDALLRQGTLREPASHCEELSYLPERARRRADLVIAYAPPPLVAAALDDASGSEGWRLDAQGAVVRMSTYNPHSKWDWWEIGGRWNDLWSAEAGVTETMVRASELLARRPLLAERACKEEAEGMPGKISASARAEALAEAAVTLAVLDAESGVWHQAGKIGWFGSMDPEMGRSDWQARYVELLEGAGERLCVVVDCHI